MNMINTQDLKTNLSPSFCSKCQEPLYKNPPTVGVALITVADGESKGVLLVERGDGGLALPGGFQEEEGIYAAIAREIREEVGLRLSEEKSAWKLFDCETTPGAKQNLLFASYREIITKEELGDFVGNAEVTRLVVVTEPTKLKFPIHQRVLEEFLLTL